MKLVFMLTVINVSLRIQASQQLIDLSHVFSNETNYWPTGEPFEFRIDKNETVTNSRGEEYHYASNTLKFSEHTGTHLDAPQHFAGGLNIWYTADIPANRLVVPISLLRLREQAQANKDYLVTRDDIIKYEEQHGTIQEESVVLFDFGWAQYWNNYTAYFGTSTRNASLLHFPGIGIQAAQLLAERNIAGVGVDTPSIDYGSSGDFDVHVYLMSRNIYGLENVADMSALPEGGKGVTLMVGVMKIEKGSGGPVRLIAMVDSKPTTTCSGRQLQAKQFLLMTIVATVLFT